MLRTREELDGKIAEIDKGIALSEKKSEKLHFFVAIVLGIALLTILLFYFLFSGETVVYIVIIAIFTFFFIAVVGSLVDVSYEIEKEHNIESKKRFSRIADNYVEDELGRELKDFIMAFNSGDEKTVESVLLQSDSILHNRHVRCLVWCLTPEDILDVEKNEILRTNPEISDKIYELRSSAERINTITSIGFKKRRIRRLRIAEALEEVLAISGLPDGELLILDMLDEFLRMREPGRNILAWAGSWKDAANARIQAYSWAASPTGVMEENE